jgi:hypothetical protein
MDLVKEYMQFNGLDDNSNDYVICDYFAGEGDWQELFKTFPQSFYIDKLRIKLIANEIEENRYNKMKDKGIIDEVYLGAFEELQIPKRSASLVLFNPPYNDDNGQRNCKRYLQMILDRELIYKNDNTYDRKTGDMIMVIREDDFIDCLDIIVRNFDIMQCYQVNNDEYSKWKQWVVYAKLRFLPLDESSPYQVISIQEITNKFMDIINKHDTFNLSMCGWHKLSIPAINYKEMKENFVYVKNNKKYISKNDNVWKWIKDVSSLKDSSLEKLIIPKKLKQGEVANIISSGYINGELSLPDGTAKHVVVGGTKNLIKTERSIEKDDNGGKIEITKQVKYTEPYINILCNKDGKTQIIELGGDDNDSMCEE